MSKYLCNFDEFDEDMGFPKMSDYFSSEPYEGKNKIVKYLKNGRKTYAAPGTETDVFTGEKISIEMCGMTDGEYSWAGVLSYYVEKYNLRLPEDFVKKVLYA